jgi:hypothetical protein
VQFIVGFPLILPFKILHAPSIFAYECVSTGQGKYIGGTIVAISSLIMSTCLWEAYTLHQQESESDSKCAASLAPGRLRQNARSVHRKGS